MGLLSVDNIRARALGSDTRAGVTRAKSVKPDEVTIRIALRLLPDVIRLIRRLVTDPDVPSGVVRVRLFLLLGYLLLSFDLVPGFIPVLGYADDAMIVAIALRSVTRTAGVDILEKHWSGMLHGLMAVRRLAGIRSV